MIFRSQRYRFFMTSIWNKSTARNEHRGHPAWSRLGGRPSQKPSLLPVSQHQQGAVLISYELV